MKCRTAIRRVSPSLDGRLRREELQQLQQHLGDCPRCALYAHQLGKLKGTLRGLPARTPPPELTAKVSLIASRERLKRLRRASRGSSLEYWGEAVRLWMHNLVRPAALPLAGGLFSAAVLFSMLAPMYANQNRYAIADVPTVLSTEAALKSSMAFGLSDNDIVVDVLVNDQGQMIDYYIPPGQAWGLNPTLRRCVENTLLCTKFTPATMFGQPKLSRLRITLRRNRIEVKG